MSDLNEENDLISLQKAQAFQPFNHLEIVDPCKTGKGILKFSPAQRENYIQTYCTSGYQTTFFIPASGAGSRMFEFLFNFLNSDDDYNQGKVERFINHFEDFAFAKKIPADILESLKNKEIILEEFIDYLLNDSGLNLGNLPKGLIPFHSIGPFVLSPFQSHIVQGVEIAPHRPLFHFTINNKFSEQIKKEHDIINNLITQKVKIEYSVQDPASDAYIFDENQELVTDKDNIPIRRPSGHGALLDNLNKLSGDIIFIKNIDNLQHYNKSKTSYDTLRLLAGIAIQIEEERNELINVFSRKNFEAFNKKYEILLESELDSISDEQIIDIINLPIRVCGMVKNEGEPGGGPFWLKKDGITRKQIIEKSQINSKDKQYSLLINSTHFNPVLMALRNADRDGNRFNLKQLVDEDQFFHVKKSQKGKKVFFTEKPGLWNGGMYNWLTIFVEIPTEAFSPVKTILDLLKPIHQENL
ncbi:MAG: DUF4301 family protein [Flavobacteriia bacterium]|nr:DUF4301 family protein [Flavobacteriia bacterium]OJX34890.1 MAG: hypothetical protein BGO87_09110 [Flavobacteriia bacterium 40-80]